MAAQDTDLLNLPLKELGRIFLLGGGKALASSAGAVRDGLMVVVEFAPNDVYRSALDLYFSRYDIDETVRDMETGLGFSGATLGNAVEADGTVVAGTFTGVVNTAALSCWA